MGLMISSVDFRLIEPYHIIQPIEPKTMCLKQLRNNVGLTQQQLAVEVSVSEKTVRCWENEGAIPSFSKAVEIAQVLQVSLEVLAIAFGLLATNSQNDDIFPPVPANLSRVTVGQMN